MNFLDGDFVLIESPSLLDCDRIRAYHLALHQTLTGLNVFPALEADAVLYPQFKLYYQKLGNMMNPVVDCDRLTPESRHEFFVCTEPVEHGEQRLPGLSGLEQLMGFSYNTEAGEEPDKTTGDINLDILTSVVLSFKGGSGIALAKRYSRESLVKMCNYAGQLLKSSTEEDDAKDKNKSLTSRVIFKAEVEADDPILVQNREEILAQLRSLNVNPPLGF